MEFTVQSESNRNTTNIMHNGTDIHGCDKDLNNDWFRQSNIGGGIPHNDEYSSNSMVVDSNNSDAWVDIGNHGEEWMDIGEALKMYSDQENPMPNLHKCKNANFPLHESDNLGKRRPPTPTNGKSTVNIKCTNPDGSAKLPSSNNESYSVEDLVVFFNDHKKENRKPIAEPDYDINDLSNYTNRTLDPNNSLFTDPRNAHTRRSGTYSETDYDITLVSKNYIKPEIDCDRQGILNHSGTNTSKNNRQPEIDCESAVINFLDNALGIDTLVEHEHDANDRDIMLLSTYENGIRTKNCAQTVMDRDCPIISDKGNSTIKVTEIGQSRSASVNQVVDVSQMIDCTQEEKYQNPTKDDILVDIKFKDALQTCTVDVQRYHKSITHCSGESNAKQISLSDNSQNRVMEINHVSRLKTEETVGSPNTKDFATKSDSSNHYEQSNEQTIERSLEDQISADVSLGVTNEEPSERDIGIQEQNGCDSDLYSELNNADSKDRESENELTSNHHENEIVNDGSHDGIVKRNDLTPSSPQNKNVSLEYDRHGNMSLRKRKRTIYTMSSESEDSDNGIDNEDSDGSYDIDSDDRDSGSLSDSDDDFLTISKRCKHCKRDFKHICILCENCKTFNPKGYDHRCRLSFVLQSGTNLLAKNQASATTLALIEHHRTRRKQNLSLIRNDFTDVPNTGLVYFPTSLPNVQRNDHNTSLDINLLSEEQASETTLPLIEHHRTRRKQNLSLIRNDFTDVPSTCPVHLPTSLPIMQRNDHITSLDRNLSRLTSVVHDIGKDQCGNNGNVLSPIQHNINSIPPGSALCFVPVAMPNSQIGGTHMQYVPTILPTQQLPSFDSSKFTNIIGKQCQGLSPEGITHQARNQIIEKAEDQNNDHNEGCMDTDNHFESPKAFKCNSCGDEFSSEWMLEKHFCNKESDIDLDLCCDSVTGITVEGNLLSHEDESVAVDTDDIVVGKLSETLSGKAGKKLNTSNQGSGKGPKASPFVTTQPMFLVPEAGSNTSLNNIPQGTKINSSMTPTNTSCVFLTPVTTVSERNIHVTKTPQGINMNTALTPTNSSCVILTPVTAAQGSTSHVTNAPQSIKIHTAVTPTNSQCIFLTPVTAASGINTSVNNAPQGIKIHTGAMTTNSSCVFLAPVTPTTENNKNPTAQAIVNNKTIKIGNSSSLTKTPEMTSLGGRTNLSSASQGIQSITGVTPSLSNIVILPPVTVEHASNNNLNIIPQGYLSNVAVTSANDTRIFMNPVTSVSGGNQHLNLSKGVGSNAAVTSTTSSSLYVLPSTARARNKTNLQVAQNVGNTTGKLNSYVSIIPAMGTRGGSMSLSTAAQGIWNKTGMTTSSSPVVLVPATASAASNTISNKVARGIGQNVPVTSTTSYVSILPKRPLLGEQNMHNVVRGSGMVTSVISASSSFISTAPQTSVSGGNLNLNCSTKCTSVIKTSASAPHISEISTSNISDDKLAPVTNDKIAIANPMNVCSVKEVPPRVTTNINTVGQGIGIISPATTSSQCVMILSGNASSGGSRNLYKVAQGVGNKAAVTTIKNPSVPQIRPASDGSNNLISADGSDKNKTIPGTLQEKQTQLFKMNDLSNDENCPKDSNRSKLLDTGKRSNESDESSNRKSVQNNSVDTNALSSSNMATAVQEKPPREKPPTKCPYCKRALWNQKKQFWKNHLEFCKKFSFYCKFCYKGFLYKAELDNHAYVHLPPSQRKPEDKHKCQICELKLSSQHGLRRHLRHVHEKVPRRKVKKRKLPRRICEICGKAIVSTFFKLHMSVHTGEKDFQCDICGFKCNRHDNLITHRRMHTGEKPFECDICGKTFTRGDNMKNHIRKMHS